MTSGFLYVAHCKDGTGRLKVGQSTDLHARKHGWAGATSIEFDLLYVVPAKRPPEAETHAHAFLDAWGCRPVGSRKELFHATLQQAKEACDAAATLVEPLPVKHSRFPLLEEPVVPLTSVDPNIAVLLMCEVRFQKKAVALGVLMALALTHRPASERLERLGVVCTYRRQANPEFYLYLDEGSVLAEWATACGIPFESGSVLHASCFPTPVLLHSSVH